MKQLIAAMFLFATSAVHADQTDRDTLALARVCVHESGFMSPDDCAAIHAVLDRVRERFRIRTIEAAANLYSPRATGRNLPRTALDRWVQQLNHSASKPPAFSHSWELNRPRWLERLEQARRLVLGTEVHQCAQPITHWGAPYGEDLARGIRAGWTQVDCGETRNIFWSTNRE